MSSTRYTEAHEFARIDGDVATVGITDYAQEQLGDVVFVDLPEVGKEIKRGDEIAVVESVKAAAEVYSPVSGEVIEVNSDLEDEPAKVNQDAMNAGWFVKIKLADSTENQSDMDDDAYKAFIAAL